MSQPTPTKEQLELIYNNSNDMIFLIGVDDGGEFRVLSVNRRYLERTGTSAGEIVGKRLDEVFQGADLEYVTAKYQEAIDSREPFRYETRTKFRDESVYLDTTLVPVFEKDRCNSIIGVSREVTLQKMESKELERAKQRAEDYLHISEAIIIALDKDANILLVNKKGCNVVGYEESELIGRNWIDLFIDPDKRERLKQDYRASMESEDIPVESYAYLMTRNGDRRLIRWTNSTLYDEAGNVTGSLSSGEDITERRRAEKAMIASQRVGAAGEVVSAVAHDFSNALQGILGNIELTLAESGLNPRAIEQLETASALASDAADRIRLLQRIAAPQSTGNAEVLDLNELLTEVIDQTRHFWHDEAQKQGVTIDVRFAGGAVGAVEGNPGELRSLFYNIVKNAAEALPIGGSITIETFRRDDMNVVQIVDDGMGMDEATAERIFQPFFSTKGFEAGRGLGMSASHAIVRSHEGEIEIRETAPGAGTTIEVRLPATQASGQGGDRLAERTESGLHLLWVDDDPEVVKLARRFIKKLGHTGEVVESGAEALSRLSAEEFDIIVTDIGMPDMSGFELAERANGITGGKVPVLAVTGWGETLSEEDRTRHGIAYVMQKPIRLVELRDVLGRLPSD